MESPCCLICSKVYSLSSPSSLDMLADLICSASENTTTSVTAAVAADDSSGSDGGDQDKNKDCPLLQCQLNVIFVLRKLLLLPGKECEWLISNHGNPSDWGTSFCPPCQKIINQAQQLSQQIKSLKIKFLSLKDKIQEELCNNESDTTAATNSKIPSENEISFKIRRLCRKNNRKNNAIKENLQDLPSLKIMKKEKRSQAFLSPTQEEEIEPPPSIFIKTEPEDFYNEDLDDSIEYCSTPIQGFENLFYSGIEAEDAEADIDPDPDLGVDTDPDYAPELDEEDKDPPYYDPASIVKVLQETSEEENLTNNDDEDVDLNYESSSRPPPPDFSLYFDCPLCDKLFPSKKFLDIHYRGAHSKRKKKAVKGKKRKPLETNELMNARRQERKYKFKCPDSKCNQFFPSEYFRDAHHKRKHQGIEKPFECEKCGKAFSRHPSLKDHEKICNGSKPEESAGDNVAMGVAQNKTPEEVSKLKCEICLKSFTEEIFKDAHVKKKHQGIEKPFECRICDKTFSRNFSLNDHLRRIHKLLKFKNEAESKINPKSNFKRVGDEVEDDKDKLDKASGDDDNYFELDDPISVVPLDNEIEDTSISKEELQTGPQLRKRRQVLTLKKDMGGEYNDSSSGDEDADDWAPNLEELGFSDSDEGVVKTSKSKESSSSTVQRSGGKSKEKTSQKEYITKGKLKCPHKGCKIGFMNEALRDGHVKIVHEGIEKPYICPVESCPRTYRKYHSLQIHSQTSHGATPEAIICENCGKTFYSRIAYKRHQNYAHRERTVECQQCGKFFPDNKKALSQHASTHRDIGPLKCALCSVTYSSLRRLYNHLKDQHKIEDESELKGHTGLDPPVKCTHCDRAFERKYDLKYHIQKEHSKEHKFNCSFCSEGFVIMSHLERHVRSFHTKEKLFKCNICGKGISRKWAFDAHMRGHTGEKPFICDQCGEAFADGRKLGRHTRTTHTEPKFDCDVIGCGRKFYYARTLRLHKINHDPEMAQKRLGIKVRAQAKTKHQKYLEAKANPEAAASKSAVSTQKRPRGRPTGWTKKKNVVNRIEIDTSSEEDSDQEYKPSGTQPYLPGVFIHPSINNQFNLTLVQGQEYQGQVQGQSSQNFSHHHQTNPSQSQSGGQSNLPQPLNYLLPNNYFQNQH